MSDPKVPSPASPADRRLPDPAREALEEPRLPAEQLEKEIGDSEAWDEASEDTGGDGLA